MYKTQSANRFKVIKETVAALIWGFISFLLWDMAESRSHTAKLFSNGVLRCCNITSHLVNTFPPFPPSEQRLGEETRGKQGLVKRDRKEVRAVEAGRMEKRQRNI